MTHPLHSRVLWRIVASLAVALPAAVGASPYTITIQGVDTSAAAIAALEADIAANPGSPRAVLAGMYVAQGNCNPASGHINSCDGTAAIGTNPLASHADIVATNASNGTNFSDAALYGYGLKLDQLILHRFNASFGVSGGIFTPPASGSFAQAFDFVVGSTGGGSAGPETPGYFEYEFDVTRDVTITGTDSLGNAIDLTQTVHQRAVLSVGWVEDTLMIYESDALSFNLGADGIIDLRLRAEGPITAGDPEIGVDITPQNSTQVPEPSSLALLGLALGLAGVARRRSAAR